MKLIKETKRTLTSSNTYSALLLILSVFFVLLNLASPDSIKVTGKWFFIDAKNVLLTYVLLLAVYLKFVKKQNLSSYINKNSMILAIIFIVFSLFLQMLLSLTADSITETNTDVLMGISSRGSYAALSKVIMYSGIMIFFLNPINNFYKYASKNFILFVGIILAVFCLLDSGINIPLFGDNLTKIEARMRFGFTNIPATTAAYKYAILYMFFLGYYLTIKKDKVSTLLISIISCICLATIFITGTRSAILFIVFATVGLILLARDIKNKRRLMIVLSVVVALIMGISYPITLKTRIDATISEYQHRSKNESIYLRVSSWDASLKTIKEKPWTGSENLRKNIIQQEINIGNYGEHMKNIHHAHNDYLESASIMGVAAMFALIIFYLTLAIITYKLELLSLFGVILSMAFFGLMDCPLINLPIINLVCLLFIIALSAFPYKNKKELL